MKSQKISRRQLLKNGSWLGPALFMLPSTNFERRMKSAPGVPFRFCLNTSTIRGQKLGLEKEIEITAQAGYDGIEIWIDSLEKFIKEGGSLKTLRSKLDDLGLKVENAIGFAKWIVDDHDVRMQGLDQARKEMDWLAQIGCHRIAAPPAGATSHGGLDLYKAAERFRALLEIGVRMDVIPQLEIWGFSKNLYRLSQVLFIAAECGHPKVRILPDIYHLYKGGSDFDGLKLLDGEVVEIFHMNDYPSEPDRNSIGDKDRVYPGDGVAPVTQVLTGLSAKSTQTVLSLELFNRELWKQDPLEVARMGLNKMKASVSNIPGDQ